MKQPLYGMMVPLHVGVSIPHQGGRYQFIPLPDTEGTYPLHPPLLVLLTVTQFHEWSHGSQGSPMASMGSNIIPSAKCTCSFQHLQPHHITRGLHPSSVDAPADIHSRNHNFCFLLIHPREVFLAGHWVTTLPILSCGIILLSPPVEVGLCGVGLVHLSHA